MKYEKKLKLNLNVKGFGFKGNWGVILFRKQKYGSKK